MEEVSLSKQIDDELNDRTKEIQNFLINCLELTPRRLLFEEHQAIVRSKEAEKTKAEARGSDETIKNFDWYSLTELQNFRLENPRDCMSSLNLKRLQRAKEQEIEFLEKGCGHRGRTERSFMDDKKHFCELRDAHKVTKPPTKMKTLRFAPENSLALSHQKFKN
jgi:hypothetical protein